MTFSWADNSTQRRFNRRARDPRLEELIRIHAYAPAKKMAGDARVRFVGPGYAFAEHWFKFKKRDGGATAMRRLCLAYNMKTGQFDAGPCPYCEMLGETGKVVVLQNAIIRSAQRMRPAESPPLTPAEKKMQPVSWAPKYPTQFRFREMSSESWSPVSVLKFPAGCAKDIAVLASGNKMALKSGGKKAVGPDHPVGGFDILIRFDPNEVPAKMYALQHEGKTKLTDKEKGYTIWKLDAEKPEKLADAIKNAERFAKTLIREDKNGGKFKDVDGESTDTDADEDEDEAPKKKVLKKKSSGGDKKVVKKGSKKPVKPEKASAKKSTKKVLKKKRRTSDMDD